MFRRSYEPPQIAAAVFHATQRRHRHLPDDRQAPDAATLAETHDTLEGLRDAGYKISGPARVWIDPVWTMSEPWRLRCYRGGDEFGRATIALQLPLLGQLVLVDPRRWNSWMDYWQCQEHPWE
jgi:hypothetical protein